MESRPAWRKAPAAVNAHARLLATVLSTVRTSGRADDR